VGKPGVKNIQNREEQQFFITQLQRQEKQSLWGSEFRGFIENKAF
jgi:hypothetical protein